MWTGPPSEEDEQGDPLELPAKRFMLGACCPAPLAEPTREVRPQNLPLETGLPPCPDDPPPDPGFATVAEAIDAVDVADRAPVCAVPPEKTLYGYGFRAPHADYHHTGHQSSAKFGDGMRGSLEIPNPNVPGGPSHHFMVGRILGKGCSGCPDPAWTEAGWVKHSIFTVDAGYNAPCPYGFDSQQDTWHVYCWYFGSLTVGNVYVFKVEHAGCPGCTLVQGLILWSGTWYVLEQHPTQRCRNSDNTANCFWEVFLEPYSSTNFHPNINGDSYGGPGANFQAIQFRRLSDGAYISWEKSPHGAIFGEVDPYEYCGFAGLQWHQFSAKKDVNCANP